MHFRDKLPAKCPPATANEISSDILVYRFCRKPKAAEVDFIPHQIRNPLGTYPDRCIASGISVFTRKDDSRRVKALPFFKNKTLITVKLTAGAGAIMQTGSDSHHTWWPAFAFNILENCVPTNA
jgi:hypothetical protein